MATIIPSDPAAPIGTSSTPAPLKKPTKKKGNKKNNKRYLWSNALHVRFLVAMVDWAEKFADLSKLHSYMGSTAQKLVTEEQLKAHKDTARHASSAARQQLIGDTDAQIKSDYDSVDKTYQPTPTTAPPVCFTDFPVRSKVPPKPVPALVNIAPPMTKSNKRTASASHKKSGAAPARLSKKRKKNSTKKSSSSKTSQPATTTTTDSQLFDFQVPGSPHPNQYSLLNSNLGSPLRADERSSIQFNSFDGFDLTDTMKHTELEMRQGMKLHREMQNRQAKQIAQYAGGFGKRGRDDQNDQGPVGLNFRRGSVGDHSYPLASSSASSSASTSRRSSFNKSDYNFDPSRLFEPNGAPSSSTGVSKTFNDYIPPLDGGISDVGEDDENLFDFMFD